MNTWYRELKQIFFGKLDGIDKHCEMHDLTAAHRVERMELRAQLDRLMKKEESKWKQRAKIDELLEGDGNTSFFHAKPNGRRRNNNIRHLDQEDGRIEGIKILWIISLIIVKKLFGHPESSPISLNTDNPRTVPRNVTDKLTSTFSLEEIKLAVFGMAHNESPSLDGFTTKFYQHYWELVKHDLKALLMIFIVVP